MEILIAAISILVLTVLIWFVNKILPFKVCPVCAGVSLTWLLMMIGILADFLSSTHYLLLTAVLMGGTVVGIAYQGEKRFSWAQKNALLFKILVVIPGFILVYLALNNIGWLTLAIEAGVLAIVIYLFFILPAVKSGSSSKDIGRVTDLEEKMEECC